MYRPSELPQPGETVTVFVSGRHDFRRKAEVLAVDISEPQIYVRWIEYNLPNEWIPARWL